MSKLSKVKKKVKALNNNRSDKSFVQFPKYMLNSIGYKLLVLHCAGALDIYLDLAIRYKR